MNEQKFIKDSKTFDKGKIKDILLSTPYKDI